MPGDGRLDHLAAGGVDHAVCRRVHHRVDHRPVEGGRGRDGSAHRQPDPGPPGARLRQLGQGRPVAGERRRAGRVEEGEVAARPADHRPGPQVGEGLHEAAGVVGRRTAPGGRPCGRRRRGVVGGGDALAPGASRPASVTGRSRSRGVRRRVRSSHDPGDGQRHGGGTDEERVPQPDPPHPPRRARATRSPTPPPHGRPVLARGLAGSDAAAGSAGAVSSAAGDEPQGLARRGVEPRQRQLGRRRAGPPGRATAPPGWRRATPAGSHGATSARSGRRGTGGGGAPVTHHHASAPAAYTSDGGRDEPAREHLGRGELRA